MSCYEPELRVGITKREMRAWANALRDDRGSRLRVAHEMDLAVDAALKYGITNRAVGAPRESEEGQP